MTPWMLDIKMKMGKIFKIFEHLDNFKLNSPLHSYIYVTARDDDVINVAGHRISTSSLEDAVLRRK